MTGNRALAKPYKSNRIRQAVYSYTELTARVNAFFDLAADVFAFPLIPVRDVRKLSLAMFGRQFRQV